MNGLAGKLLLSDVASMAQISVVRDVAFATLGFASAPLPHMLGFAQDQRFVRLATRLDQTAGLITRPELAELVPDKIGLAVSSDPLLAFSRLHNYLARETDFYTSALNFDTQLAEDALVHELAYIAGRGVRIGSGSRVAAHASVLTGSAIGEGVTLHEGVLAGSVGLQVERFGDRLFDLEHVGRLEIGDGVQVMGNSVIARGLFRQSTVLGKDVRIGNLAYVSHNVVIGSGSIIGHGVTINGGARIGEGVSIGPGSTIANGVEIGDGAQVTLGSVVVRGVPRGKRVTGNFSVDHRVFMRRQGRLR